ncbi:MAG: hypothetical protein AAF871_15120 [Pseudomonadota bacterium]
MRIADLALVFVLFAPAAHAACPVGRDISQNSAELLLELRETTSEYSARLINAALWNLWLSAPDQAAQDLLNSGMSKIRSADYSGADADFDALIAYCPDYAEGYNQRAFSAYLQADYERALEDIDAALERTPTHLGALSGKALTLFGLGRIDAGQDVLREALALNPWLPERRFLIEKPGEQL